MGRTGLTDEAFQTLVHVLQQSPSLHTLDLSDNELSMTSVSDIAQLLTSITELQMLSVARNNLPLHAIGYLMTAMLERQAQDMEPPVLVNFTDNQGLLNLKVSLRAANL